MFKALMMEKADDGKVSASVRTLSESDLPEGDVLVRISHSTINYKDGLALTNSAPIIRSYPLVPGIDFAGVVEESTNPAWKPGDAVILNGWGVGESHSGGLAEKARVKGEWLIPLPKAFSAAHAMAVGTAGYTAMLCVLALEKCGLTPAAGPVLVTGASGGVGGMAVLILARLGYQVVASTGRMNEADYLKALGADSVIDRATLSAPGRPLAKEQWAGAVDSVGSHTLANVLAGLKRDGVAAACGLAQGMDLPASVAPFILRGITLTGVDSVYQPKERRIAAWDRLARDLDLKKVDSMITTIGLAQVPAMGAEILAGNVRGRLVVDLAL